ncbi:MAG: type II toxin-antitoxin system RelE/ParE family toxin [Chloroflexota bacterium]|nr:type II toxin-antitoxin system RelE/ParE family toxin [Chloroflexota bacterium]
MSSVSFSIQIKGSARKALEAIPQVHRDRIRRAIDALGENPYAGQPLAGQFSGTRRIRVGTYRVLYEIHRDELWVLVIRVASRGSAYR